MGRDSPSKKTHKNAPPLAKQAGGGGPPARALPPVGQLVPTSSLSSGAVGTTLLLTTGWPEAIGLTTYAAVLRENFITSRGACRKKTLSPGSCTRRCRGRRLQAARG